MRLSRALCGAAGALAVTLLGGPACADEPTPISLVEVYEITPGVSATHEVTLSTDRPLIGEQCQSMGTAAGATSSALVDVGGVAGCRFTWLLPDAGAEVVSVDSGGVFRFRSVSARLLEGYSSPEASALISRVTLIAHASLVEETSAGGTVSSHAGSTKTDATTVTWENVTEDVSATGTVDSTATAPSSTKPLPSPPASAAAEGGDTSSAWRSLTPVLAVTAAALALALVGAAARAASRSRRRAADARFERERALRAARRDAFSSVGRGGSGGGEASSSSQASAREDGSSISSLPGRFAPPGHD